MIPLRLVNCQTVPAHRRQIVLRVGTLAGDAA